MELANVMVALGGDPTNTTPRYGVTPSEIALLRAIHGDDAVFDVEPLGRGAGWSSREDLARLRGIYSTAKDRDGNLIIDRLFPGAGARAIETIDDLELAAELFKPVTRAVATPAPAAPAPEGGKRGRKPKAPEPAPVAADDESDELPADDKADVLD